MTTFGERISTLRNHRGLSQSELAARLNIAKSTLAMYETDKREPGFEVVQRIADFFNVTTDYLITGEVGTSHGDPAISPEELEFLKWVDDNVESSFFYDFSKSPEESKREMMETLKFIWEREKSRLARSKKNNDTLD